MGSHSDPPIPRADAEPQDGSPLLLLLEGYVLDSIGALPRGRRPELLQIVRRVFGGGSDWKATLRETLHLDASIDETFRRMWADNQQIARDHRVTLEPEEFVRQLVQANFGSLMEAAPGP